MRRLGRYGFFILGLLNVTSFALVALLATSILPLVPDSKRPALLAMVDVACGMVTVFLGFFVAQWLGTPGSLWISLVCLGWFAVHFARLKRVNAFIRASLGMLMGWLILLAFDLPFSSLGA